MSSDEERLAALRELRALILRQAELMQLLLPPDGETLQNREQKGEYSPVLHQSVAANPLTEPQE